MWTTFILYWIAFLALAAYLFAQSYITGRTSSFITLDETSGVCIDDPASTTCCEVASTITGTFLADSTGKWNTFDGFNFVKNNYAVTMTGVRYTNSQWTSLMKTIVAQIKDIGTRGASRDFAWNMVAWTSYSAVNMESGRLQFYGTGDPGIMFGKKITAVGFASNASDAHRCKPFVTTTFNELSRKLEMNIDLNIDNSCPNPPCRINPCPGVLGPQIMGYDTEGATSSVMNFKLDMVSITTALAVNMGMITLDNLVNIPGDNDRINLLQALVDADGISQTTMESTSSYFDSLYAPTTPIYW